MRIPKKTPKYNFRNNIGMIARSPSEAEYPNLWKGLTGWWSANVKSTPPKDGLKSLAYDPTESLGPIDLSYTTPAGSYGIVAGPRGWRVDFSGNLNGGGWSTTNQNTIGSTELNDFTIMIGCKLDSTVTDTHYLYRQGYTQVGCQYYPGSYNVRFYDFEDIAYTSDYSMPNNDDFAVLGHRSWYGSDDKDHFINGVRVGGRNGGYYGGGGDIRIGDGTYSSMWFDWFATWRRALSDEEIWRLYSDVDYTPLTRKVTFQYRPISYPTNYPLKKTEYTFNTTLTSQSTGLLQSSPTLADNDVQVSKDGGAFTKLTNLPVVSPAGTAQVKVTLTDDEMDADIVGVQFQDQAGAEWSDKFIEIKTDVITGGTVKTGSTTTVVTTSLAEATDDHFNDMFIKMIDGALAGQSRKISDYSGADKTITVATAFTDIPADHDHFVILGRSE